MTEVEAQREALTSKRGQIMCYLQSLRDHELITQFDEALWCGTVDQVRVTKEAKLRFIFKDGTEIEIA